MKNSNTVDVPTVDIGLLRDGDGDELEKLFAAAKDNGVFYLDLHDKRYRSVLHAADEIFALSRELFELDRLEKLEYDVDKLTDLKINGYKPIGRNFGGIEGDRDGFESYVMAKVPGKMHLDTMFPRPSVISARLPSLLIFVDRIHEMLSLLLSSLSIPLNLPKEQSLAGLHRRDEPSTDVLRLLHYVCQPDSETGIPQTAHTDLGSLTLLFTTTPGLQVSSRHGTDWTFVTPKPHCVVVNIGDGLSWLTGGLFNACRHRVSPLPGQSMDERYSIAYLQRAEDNVRMESVLTTDAESVRELGVFTSREWVEKKFNMLRRKA